MNDLTIAVFSFNGHQDLLPYLLKSIKEHGPACKEIVVVWDDLICERGVDFDTIKKQSGCDFRVVKHTEVHSWPEAIARWGWIRQQLVKLFCASYTTTKYTWIVDGDVLLTGDPELFNDQGKPYIRYDKDYPIGVGYMEFIKKYLNIHNFYQYDLVGSTFLFDRDQCQQIFSHAQRTAGLSLVQCVDHCITQPNHDEWPFSEFLTYGTWVYNNSDPDTYVLQERNWRGNREKRYDRPIQIQWDYSPHPRHRDLKARYEWINQQSGV
jgi:hypothetical protein